MNETDHELNQADFAVKKGILKHLFLQLSHKKHTNTIL